MQPVILYPPTIDWDYLHQRPQQLFKALAVLGCTCIFYNINAHNRHPDGFTQLAPNLLLANGQEFNSSIQVVRSMYPGRPLVTYFTYPPHIVHLQRVKTDLLVFDSVDEPVDDFAYWLPGYAAAVTQADIVTATACSLADRARLLRSEVSVLPNGCDYDHFKLAQNKQRLSVAPFSQDKPIIGYIGAIAPWVDMRLVNTLARCMPAYEFVLIGPLLKQNGIALLHKNIHYLHHKAYAELPCYLSNFSYCLIPFKITAMTKGVNPVKFWEYLASGIPILSTPLPEIPAGYVSHITTDMILPGFSPPSGERSRADRIQLARANAWHNRAESLLALINSKLAWG